MVPDYHAHANIAQGTDPLQASVSVLTVNSSYKSVGYCFELLNMRGSRLPHMLHFNQSCPCEILKPVACISVMFTVCLLNEHQVAEVPNAAVPLPANRVCLVQYITPHRLTCRRLYFHFRLLTNCSFKSGKSAQLTKDRINGLIFNLRFKEERGVQACPDLSELDLHIRAIIAETTLWGVPSYMAWSVT